MIGKAPAAGSGFRGLISYLMRGKRNDPNPHRVAWTETRNLLIDDVELAPRLMRITAQKSARVQKPVYHLAIAWHRDENPSDELMRQVADQTCADLGLAEHQRALIAHDDTAHRHVHIVVNRVHPDSGKAWHKSNDWKHIEISLRRQAEAMGMPYVPGRHNDPERFRNTPKHVRDGEFQAALRHARPKPPERWSADQIATHRGALSEAFDGARSWDQLGRTLAERGLRLERKGQGIIIAGADGFMKLSELRKDVRLAGLEQRFGETFAQFSEHHRHGVEQRPARAPMPNSERLDTLSRTGTAATHRHEQQPQQEPHRSPHDLEAQRERIRQARRDRHQTVPANPAATSESEDANSAHASAAARTKMHHPQAQAPKAPTEADAAYATLRQARAALDLTHSLDRLGLIRARDVAKAKNDLERAQEQLNPHLTGDQRLARDLQAALASKRVQRDDRDKSRTRPAPKSPNKRKRDRDDRER